MLMLLGSDAQAFAELMLLFDVGISPASVVYGLISGVTASPGAGDGFRYIFVMLGSKLVQLRHRNSKNDVITSFKHCKFRSVTVELLKAKFL